VGFERLFAHHAVKKGQKCTRVVGKSSIFAGFSENSRKFIDNCAKKDESGINDLGYTRMHPNIFAPEIDEKGDWTPRAVIYALGSKKKTPSDLATELQRTRSCISHVLAGHWTSRHVEQKIADVLEIEPQEIWPSRYGVDTRRRELA